MMNEEIVDEMRRIEFEILSLNQSNPQYPYLLEDCMMRLSKLMERIYIFIDIKKDEDGLPKRAESFSRVHRIPEVYKKIGD